MLSLTELTERVLDADVFQTPLKGAAGDKKVLQSRSSLENACVLCLLNEATNQEHAQIELFCAVTAGIHIK